MLAGTSVPVNDLRSAITAHHVDRIILTEGVRSGGPDEIRKLDRINDADAIGPYASASVIAIPGVHGGTHKPPSRSIPATAPLVPRLV